MKIHVAVFAVALPLVPIAALTAEPPVTSIAATPATARPAPAPAALAPPAATADPAISKAAHSMGYKVRQHDGKAVYCKSETKVGTNFPSTTCLSEDQVLATVKRSEGNKDSVEALQRAFRAAAPPMEPQMGMRGQ